MPFRDIAVGREYQRQWKAKRRAAYFADKSCVLCRSTNDLELDHIDKKLKVSHKIWSWSKVRREQELAKCQVLCSKCHDMKHHEEISARMMGNTIGSGNKGKPLSEQRKANISAGMMGKKNRKGKFKKQL